MVNQGGHYAAITVIIVRPIKRGGREGRRRVTQGYRLFSFHFFSHPIPSRYFSRRFRVDSPIMDRSFNPYGPGFDGQKRTSLIFKHFLEVSVFVLSALGWLQKRIRSNQ